MKRAALFAATALALLVPLVWFGGCVSTPLPHAEVDARAPATRLDLRLGVEASRVKPFSEELVRALRASGFFAEVDFVDRMRQPPDLVAKIEHGWQGAAVIPFFTVLTLGLVPTIAEETYGLEFSLRAPAAPENSVVVDARWSGRVWLGVVAALLNTAPGRTSEDWRGHPRWIAFLRHELERASAELAPLASAAAIPAHAPR